MFETQSLSSHMCKTIRKTFKQIQKLVLPKWTLRQKTARKMFPCSQGPRLAGECLKFQGISTQWYWLWGHLLLQPTGRWPESWPSSPPLHSGDTERPLSFSSSVGPLVPSPPLIYLCPPIHFFNGPSHLLQDTTMSSTPNTMLRVWCRGDGFILIQLEKCLGSSIAKFYLSKVKKMSQSKLNSSISVI